MFQEYICILYIDICVPLLQCTRIEVAIGYFAPLYAKADLGPAHRARVTLFESVFWFVFENFDCVSRIFYIVWIYKDSIPRREHTPGFEILKSATVMCCKEK